jgi:hypothetical protein
VDFASTYGSDSTASLFAELRRTGDLVIVNGPDLSDLDTARPFLAEVAGWVLVHDFGASVAARTRELKEIFGADACVGVLAVVVERPPSEELHAPSSSEFLQPSLPPPIETTIEKEQVYEDVPSYRDAFEAAPPEDVSPVRDFLEEAPTGEVPAEDVGSQGQHLEGDASHAEESPGGPFEPIRAVPPAPAEPPEFEPPGALEPPEFKPPEFKSPEELEPPELEPPGALEPPEFKPPEELEAPEFKSPEELEPPEFKPPEFKPPEFKPPEALEPPEFKPPDFKPPEEPEPPEPRGEDLRTRDALIEEGSVLAGEEEYEEEEGRRRGPSRILAGVLVLAALAVAALFYFGGGDETPPGSAPPVSRQPVDVAMGPDPERGDDRGSPPVPTEEASERITTPPAQEPVAEKPVTREPVRQARGNGPATVVAPVRDGEWGVHVTSMQSESGAHLEIKLLREAGYPALIRRIEVPNKGLWYRIYVGPAETKEAAAEIARDIKQSGVRKYAQPSKIPN